MGPVILLDKSAFEALSPQEAGFLVKHYYVNLSPILLMEILADLKKSNVPGGQSGKWVASLANKLLQTDSKMNVHYTDLCLGSLLGFDVPQNRSIVIPPGRPVQSADGRPGVFYDVTPENLAILRWQQQRFTEAEQLLAGRWREISTDIDVDGYRKRLASAYVILPAIDDFKELSRGIEDFLSTPSLQTFFVEWLLAEVSASASDKEVVMRRWQQRRSAYLKEFAPYAYYCAKINFVFVRGVLNNLINTSPRAKARIDIQYCYYLPFCMVFTSSDKLHRDLAALFLENDQAFVDGKALKADLASIVERWHKLSDQEQLDDAYDRGSYPPPNPESITHQLWLKYMKPWKPGSGNALIKMTKKQEQELMEYLRPMMVSIDGKKRKES